MDNQLTAALKQQAAIYSQQAPNTTTTSKPMSQQQRFRCMRTYLDTHQKPPEYDINTVRALVQQEQEMAPKETMEDPGVD